jgi:hypothetical protein
MGEDVRSPIVPIGDEARVEVESAMRHAGLLN